MNGRSGGARGIHMIDNMGLNWRQPPSTTWGHRFYAMLAAKEKAGIWFHFTIFGIPNPVSSLAE